VRRVTGPASKAALAVCCAGVLSALTACGAASEKAAAPQSPPEPSGGGLVGAEATTGLIGSAASVENGRQTLVGQTARISPNEDKPTDAQQNGVAGGAACASASSSPSNANLAAMSAAIGCLLNAERTSKGLAPLKLNTSLTKASRLMAGLMVKQHFFAHDTPDGRNVLDRVRPTGYIRGNWSLGENIAWGSGSLASPRAIVNGWMHSTGHRENILRAAFHDIGIGIKLGAPGPGLSGGATYVTDFGRHG
jgi:uncharacterized protein YkwD